MNGVALFLLFLSFGTPLGHGSQPPEVTQKPDLFLTQGEQRLLHVPRLSKYALGNPKIRVLKLPIFRDARTSTSNESLLLKAIEEGVCDLWVWKTDGSSEHRSIRIQKPREPRPSPKLDQSLEKLIEVEVLQAGPQVILRGEILSLAESARIAALSEGFPNEIRDETQVSETLLKSAQGHVETWLRTTGNSSRLSVEQEGNQLWIRGAVDRPNRATSIKKQLRAIFPLLQFELDSPPDRAPTLSFKVFLLELKKSQFSNLGLFWGASTPATLQASTQGLQDALKIDLAIQHLEGQGQAKVLSNPELVVRAPGEAELFAGGELPVILRTRLSQSINWKPYGLTLRLKVTHAAGRRVRLDVSTEVSHLGPDLTGGGIPGIQTNRMTTQVDAQLGVPLLMSGLLQDKIREEARGLPILRSIPVLGTLFGSDDYLNERSELVAILFPRITPAPVSIQSLRRNFPTPSLYRSDRTNSWSEESEAKTSKNYPWSALE